jgi:hypothetical protein
MPFSLGYVQVSEELILSLREYAAAKKKYDTKTSKSRATGESDNNKS